MKLTQEEISQAILITLRWLLGTALVGAFGIGWFLSEMHADIQSMQASMIEVKDNIPPKWVADSLADVETELKRQQVQIDRLEARVAGTPYDGKGYDGR